MTNNREQKYNGYTNYETWVVALWIDSNESEQEFWRKQAQEFLKSSTTTIFKDGTMRGFEKNAIYSLSESLKENMAELNLPQTIMCEGLYADLLNSALSEVNWYEIAENLIESAKEVTV